MRKLTPSEKKILDRLLYPEPFEVIQEETQLAYGEIRDDLINLMNSRLIEAVDPDDPNASTTNYFDSDNVRDSVYRITNSGINLMKRRS
ncbi:hypothetical protein [Gracilimonas amylolytica]|uniref:hypothetical protein n=1 Tax=Gracilimonas amylolytica TaxID=1749045 RepID=UPI000CD7F232|nr:hypothetical protein [Gracilimonas amylolytica]